MKTSLEQMDNINYLKEHDMLDLIDDKIKLVIKCMLEYIIENPDIFNG